MNAEQRLTLSYLGSDGLPYFQSLPVDDLVAAWRATVLLPHLGTIQRQIENVQPGTLKAVYAVVRRNFLSWDQGYADRHLPGISSGLYDQIMGTPVPEVIIRAIIDGQGKPGEPLLHILTREIQAGTVEWRQEFVGVGITNPTEQELQDPATLARYEELLSSYAAHFKLGRKDFTMELIEDTLFGITEEHIKQPEEILVALASLLVAIHGIKRSGSPSKKLDSPLAREQLAIRSLALWLTKKNRPKGWHLFANVKTWRWYEEFLTKLRNDLLPPSW